MNRAVFLDRDGVLNIPVVRDGLPYPPDSVADFQLYPEVAGACADLHGAGFFLVVVTNQPDVGRGTQTMEAVDAMHRLLTKSVTLDRIEICTAPDSHAPEARRRKPAPGMLLDAAQALGVDLPQSYIVGDRWRDIDAGHAAGCRTIFIDRGYAESLRQPPHYRCGNLREAAELILRLEAQPLPTSP